MSAPHSGYKSSEVLEITDAERQDLIDMVPRLLANSYEKFDMGNWSECICAHMESRKGNRMGRFSRTLNPLFIPCSAKEPKCWAGVSKASHASQTQAAAAIVAFLHGSELL